MNSVIFQEVKVVLRDLFVFILHLRVVGLDEGLNLFLIMENAFILFDHIGSFVEALTH